MDADCVPHLPSAYIISDTVANDKIKSSINRKNTIHSLITEKLDDVRMLQTSQCAELHGEFLTRHAISHRVLGQHLENDALLNEARGGE